MNKSVGVLVAEKVSKTMGINYTIWVDETTTLADEIDSIIDYLKELMIKDFVKRIKELECEKE